MAAMTSRENQEFSREYDYHRGYYTIFDTHRCLVYKHFIWPFVFTLYTGWWYSFLLHAKKKEAYGLRRAKVETRPRLRYNRLRSKLP